ncbi:MAG: bifunctional 4-hydroxy-3-methylbut-2-enyl diphosphate reductase/30S ribosomal protein S1 [Oscillospiraceae bacterium]|nr:bifunctional 4-hydroxy-3-methylbut-2-enyl diphosphate reductase/30S ribosomal protein S1 [Oscillospiraceae bacterium]
MPIILAKSAGFCFGVKRAVDMTNALLKQGASVSLLGPLIHNREVMRDFEASGAVTVDSPAHRRPGDTVVVRAHGVPKETMAEIEEAGIPCCDATCPFVKKIHEIVSAHSSPEIPVLILGNPDHPEVIGIRSCAKGEALVAENADSLEKLLLKRSDLRESALVAVVQTTFQAEEWKKSIKKLNFLCTNVILFDTICNATQTRQEEARALAAACDAMVIIGDRLSSNTAKLLSVCEELCPSFLVEGCGDLSRHREELSAFRDIGCTAGASTPARTIKEVLTTMSELLNEVMNPETAPVEEEAAAAVPAEEVESVVDAAEEAPAEEAPAEEAVAEEAPAEEAAAEAAETAEEAVPATEEDEFTLALEESLKGMNTDQKVKGIVTAVNLSEIQVDIGRKQTGYVAASEYSRDPSADLTQEVKIGDVLDLIILKTNDAEGTVQLSKKRFDAAQAWNNIIKAEEDGTVLEGKIVEVVKAGVVAMVKGMRVFIPGSLAGVPRSEPLDGLMGQTVRFRVIEVNKQRRRAVGSIRSVSQEERKSAEANFWAAAEVGQVYHGKVKSLVSYGAFVDIGGLDGMVHISELSWGRVKDPSEVVSVGDEVDVYVKALDPEKRKISLGYRKAEDNPWEILRQRYPVDSVVDAKVVSFTSFGAFARVLPGVDGLIHISQIADRRVEKPQDELSIGQEVKVKIVGIDFEKRRVSLSIRALAEDAVEEEAYAPEEEEDAIVASSSSED